MEPGREDREHPVLRFLYVWGTTLPQWNPAVKTGSTRRLFEAVQPTGGASMEPGREDREHRPRPIPARSRPDRLNGTRP